MSVTACPACGSPQLKNYRPSRRTGRSNFRCRGCGLVGWSERADLVLPDTVSIDEISVEERAAWVASKRNHAAEAAQVEVLDELGARLEGGPEGRLLYDIGTGDGQFLAVASARGYQVRGNDLMEANVALAARSHGVDVDLGDLSTLDVPAQDAVTMWCVLAHVADPEALLRSSFDVLKPGGTLFLQTPRRSKVDTAALKVTAAAGGRMSRWVDRRIAPHHWHLHTAASMTAALRAVGFVDVEVIPRARYSLNSGAYLASLGVPTRAAGAIGRTTDRLIDRGWAPRIVLEAYARKPGTLAAPAAATALEQVPADESATGERPKPGGLAAAG
ncbi:MAG TPA: methyltransferase domain-containing protein [Nocardioides sp.]|nr:methyltransferase domain-containing protein [Nocardioides sp.]